jgi:hypothetical protein
MISWKTPKELKKKGTPATTRDSLKISFSTLLFFQDVSSHPLL